MTEPIIPNEKSRAIKQATGFFAGGVQDFMRQFRLVWQLLVDGRVPMLTKMIPLLAALYVLSPVDLVPDMALGFGQLDDLLVLLLGLRLFIDVCPPDLVLELDAEPVYTSAAAVPVTDQPRVIIDVEPHIPDDVETVGDAESGHFERENPV